MQFTYPPLAELQPIKGIMQAEYTSVDLRRKDGIISLKTF